MKKSLLLLLTAGLLVIGTGRPALAQDKSEPDSGQSIKILSSVDVDEKIDGKPARASTVEVTFEPGGSGSPHRHPGAVFGYVIEGAFEFKIEKKPMQTLKAGATFYEPTMVLHEIGQNASETARTRVLAIIVHPRDAEQLVIPEKPGN